MIVNLLPPNLADLGVKRHGDGVEADLWTLYKSPYPMITNYKMVMSDAGIQPFAGGTLGQQGSNYLPGYCTSGFRDLIIDGHNRSPHLYALAIDVAIGDVEEQARVAHIASKHFNRVGLYPDNGFIHMDLMPPHWIAKYGGSRFWVKKNGIYKSFQTLNSAIIYTGVAA